MAEPKKGMDAIEKAKAFIAVTPGMNQSRFAEASGLTKARVSDLLRREFAFTNIHNVMGFAKAMKVSVEYLMDDRLNWPPPVMVETPKLDRDEMRLLELAREMGLEVARARMLKLPEPRPAESRRPGPAEGTVEEPSGEVPGHRKVRGA